MEISIRWDYSGRGVLAWLLEELEYERCYTEYEWEEYEWYYASHSDSWHELICHIDDNNRYHEWKKPKRDESEWYRYNSEDGSENEIDHSEDNCEEECWNISIRKGDTSDRIHLSKKVYSSCCYKKVDDISHRKYWIQIMEYTIVV